MLKKTGKDKNWMKWKSQYGQYMIQPVCDEIIRVVYTVLDEIKDGSDLIEKNISTQFNCQWYENDRGWGVKTKKLDVFIDGKSEEIVYRKRSGEILLKENGREAEKKPLISYTTKGEKPVIDRVKTIDGERNFIKNLYPEEKGMVSKAKIHFALKETEGIYGFGQAEEGIFNYRYEDQYLYQHNMRTPMPFFVSTEKYGLFVDCGSVMTWHGGKKDSYLFLDSVFQADTYFIFGESMDEIIGNYRLLTGKAPIPPRWALGYMQSREMYHSAQELLNIVEEYRKRKVPLDCVIQDWKSWKPQHWGEKILDPERYGDAKEKFDAIHAKNAHVMISVWPTAAEGTIDYQQFMEKGYLLNDCATYNAFEEGARELYWKQMKEGLFDNGFDAWWCDSTEPFSGKDWNGAMKREPWERYFLVSEEHKAFLSPEKANLYGREHAKGIYENQRKTTEKKRVVNLTRSGYSGSQKYGTILWSGDITATWRTMKKQIVEGLQMGMSGFPYWTLDIGGFFTVHENWKHRGCDNHTNPNMLWFWQGDYEEGVDDLGYRELYTRWLQMGTFLPVFRSHGTDTPREIWNFGEPGTMFYESIKKFISLRYSLMPYIYSMAAEVYFNDYTIMRSLLFDFSNDKKACGITDGFMFGTSLLVYPVTVPMYFEKNSVPIKKECTVVCYLPSGCGWYDFWTNEFYEGGQEIIVDAPIDKMPIFVKEGTILPRVTDIQYADEIEGKQLNLYVYTGKNAFFRYYEDSGDGYGYEKGEYALTEFFYDEKTEKLWHEKRKGTYPGMKKLDYKTVFVKKRKF